MSRNRITIVVNKDTHRTLRNICKRHGLSIDDALRSLMRNWVDQGPEQTTDSISSRDEVITLAASARV